MVTGIIMFVIFIILVIVWGSGALQMYYILDNMYEMKRRKKIKK